MSELREAIEQGLKTSQAIWNDRQVAAVEKSIVEAAGGPDHLIVVKGAAWTIQHPITERFASETGGSNLFSCKVTQMADAAAHSIALSEGNGKYRLWFDAGALLWERV